ncbi:DEAD/DEAH box helicase [Burkholderia sp. LMG 32019]|uniref:DEAD/DEAH box helicase n=1 Tax=Burkholderia sp. LMG 32019 TaxID=3158173 RepID=UPI003C2CC1C7
MAFRGLFIGIDRYKSKFIDWLSCSVRDACALDAMFADNLGGHTVLLTDEQATKNRIEAEFESLYATSPDDVVVIAYSGHGTESHQLVAYDTEIDNLDGSTVSLQSIADRFAKIPARRMILVLDCCFAGGIGTKVLRVEELARDLMSAEARLERMSGEGRLIVTASGSNEPAWENRRFKHGVFTYYLLQALQGVPGGADASRVNIYQIIQYVVQQVTDHTANSDEPQNPAIRGTVDGEFSWPVFQIGERFRNAFPELAEAVATEEILSLTRCGFPEEAVTAWGENIAKLNDLQISAINEYGVLRGENLVVSAPTSSGKTMIGELAALNSVFRRGRAAFLFPLKALVADKLAHFEKTYGRLGVRTIEATGETDDIRPLVKGQYDVALLTYEKFTSICVTFPHVLRQLDVIVVDEAQMIADESRGANLEFLLTLIRARPDDEPAPQIIALSAVIGDTNGLERWLAGRLLRKLERPVPLNEGVLSYDGTFHYVNSSSNEESIERNFVQTWAGKGSSQDVIIPLLKKLVTAGEQVIVFRNEKGLTLGCANYLARELQLPSASAAIAELPSTDASQANSELRQVLAGGVAFHNADLAREEREIVERHFRDASSGIRVIVATTTLAMGINTPASSVVIAGLTHPLGKPYTVAEYKNLCGRAGRMGFAEQGRSFLVLGAKENEYAYWSRYVCGTPEDLLSWFLDDSTDPRTLICRLMTATQRWAKHGFTADQFVTFLECSFAAHIAKSVDGGWRLSHSNLVDAIGTLEQHKFVEQNDEGKLRLTDLGRVVGETGIEVDSAISILGSLHQLSAEQISDPTLLSMVQQARELDGVYLPINASSTQKEPNHWFFQLQGQGVPQAVLSSLRSGVEDTKQATRRAKRAVACLLYVSGVPMAMIERNLGQFGGAFGGMAGPVRAVASRTCDFLTATGRLATVVHPGLDLDGRLARLSTRLTLGVTGAMAALAGHIGAALTRGEYAQLESSGFVDAASIQAATDDQLARCVDGLVNKVRTIRAGANALLRAAEEAKLIRFDMPIYME